MYPNNPMLWLLKHPPSGSVFAVEYDRVNGKAKRVSQGFVFGNVVNLNTYRKVKKMAVSIFT